MNKFILLPCLCIVLLGLNIYQAFTHITITHPTDYHFNVDSTGYTIYTQDMKEIGHLPWGENLGLDDIILTDNQ